MTNESSLCATYIKENDDAIKTDSFNKLSNQRGKPYSFKRGGIMFGLVKRRKRTYFINYRIQWHEDRYSLQHVTVDVKSGSGEKMFSEIVKHLALKHGCKEEQILVNTLNEI